jgi:hypothetical protein
MPRFQVSCDLSACGYLELEAATAKEAQSKIERLHPDIDWGFGLNIDTALFDANVDIRVNGVVEVKEEL